MEQIMQKLHEWLALYGLNVLGAIVIIVLGRLGAGFMRSVIRRLMQRARMEQTLVSFVTSVTYVALMAFIIVAALGKLGMQTASFVAVLGAAGLAVGLALQGSLANFASGVLMIIFKPFKVGDYVEGGGAAGTVEEIGIFATELRSPDNKTVIVPNSKLTADNIVNYSANDNRRVDIVVGVSYADDLDKVRHTLTQLLSNDPRILQEPSPTIGVIALADSSVNIAVRPWVKTSDYWAVFFDLQETIKKQFDAEGIRIPFPQHDVHIFNQSEAK